MLIRCHWLISLLSDLYEMTETFISLYFVMMAFKYDYTGRYLVTPDGASHLK